MNRILQHLTALGYDLVMWPAEVTFLRRVRHELISQAYGDVLELGAGSGVNVRYYDDTRVRRLTVSDRTSRESVYTLRGGTKLNAPGKMSFEPRTLDAQQLPYPDDSFDTVVATLVFCSVECAPCGFSEIRRVLRPGGQYLFIDHVRPRNRKLATLFDRANPVWNRITGGCNLNRDTVGALRDAGFSVELKPEATERVADVFLWGTALPTGDARLSRSPAVS